MNPLFLKLIWQESSLDIIAQYSADIFNQIKTTIEEDFPEAVMNHLVSKSYYEAATFRIKAQITPIINTAFASLNMTYTRDEIAGLMMNESSLHTKSDCGLNIYLTGSHICPLTVQPYLNSIRSSNANLNLTDDVNLFLMIIFFYAYYFN